MKDPKPRCIPALSSLLLSSLVGVAAAAEPEAAVEPKVEAPAASEKETVFVLEVKTQGIDTPALGDTVSAEVARVLAEHGYAAMTSAEVKDRLETETHKELLGCESNSACIAELTDPAGADLVVVGSLGRIGRSFLLNLSLLDPKTATPRSRAGTSFEAPDQLSAAVGSVLAELFGWQGATPQARFELPEGEATFLVLDITSAGVSEETSKNLTQVLTREIKAVEGASVVSRDDLVGLVGFERMKTLLSECDESCLVEIGGALDTQYIVIGQVGKLSDTFIVSLTLVDQTASAVGTSYRVSEAFRSAEDQLIPAVAHAGRRLLGLDIEGTGRVQVASPVSEAEVFIDEGEAGALPLPPVVGLSPGRHSLRLAKGGYYDWYSDVYVGPGQTTAVWAELEAQPEKWYEKWWVWTAVGVVVVGATAGAIAASQGDPELSTVNFDFQSNP